MWWACLIVETLKPRRLSSGMSFTISVVLPAPLHPAKPITRMAPAISFGAPAAMASFPLAGMTSHCVAHRGARPSYDIGKTPFAENKIALAAIWPAHEALVAGSLTMTDSADVFAAFRSEVAPQTPLRSAITAAYRRPEPDCVPPLIKLATASADEASRIRTIASSLVARLRAKTRSSGVEGLIHEYSLSSQEGVALMCLAEALLRIPDAATRDALIRDKLSPGDWRAHVGQSPSLFVNAATWGLVLTGQLVTTTSEQSLTAALTRLIARSGEPIIRAGVDVAMRLMGEQFVTGRTIEEAIGNAPRARGARLHLLL